MTKIAAEQIHLTPEQQETVASLVPFIKRIARHAGKKLPLSIEGITREDLVSVGCVVACRKIGQFDPDNNGKATVEQFIYPYVWGAMLDYIRSQTWGMRAKLVREGKISIPKHRSLHPETSGKKSERAHDGTRSDDHHEAQHHLAVLENGYTYIENLLTLKTAWAKLSAQEKKVLTLSFFEGRTLAEIGKLCDVSGSRICQIKNAALSRMRELMTA